MSSHRLSWNAEENALTRALFARRAAGLEVLELTESNPTRAGLPRDEAALLAALNGPRTLSYEPDPKGLRAAREAVARYYADKGARVDPERIVLTASTSEAYSWLFKLLCDPGDQVLVPEPSYPLFGWLTALESVASVPYELRFDGEWHLEPGSLRTALDAAPRARALLVVSPGNPTGAFLKEAERALLAQACRERGLALISDEVFADFAARPDPRRVATVAAHDDVLSFALSGLSKVAGLPQLKLSWCAVSGPVAEADRAVAQLELIADTFLSVGSPVQHAAAALLESRHSFQRALRERLERNLRALHAARPDGAPWDVLPAEGGWSAILSVPRARSEEAWALALLEAGVLAHPGYFFDFPSGAHLVLSLLPEEAIFAEAVARIAAVVR
jgi:alanine-synthesizing transaminase